MAKKQTKKAPTRRRRMGATGGGKTGEILMMLGGAVVGQFVTSKLPDTIGGTDISKFKNAIPVAVGFLAPKVVKSPKMKPFFNGMIIGGGLGLVKDSGVLGSIGMYSEAPLLGYVNQRQIAGVPMQQQMYQSKTPFVGGVI